MRDDQPNIRPKRRTAPAAAADRSGALVHPAQHGLTAVLRDLNRRPDQVLAPETWTLLQSIDRANRQGGWLDRLRTPVQRGESQRGGLSTKAGRFKILAPHEERSKGGQSCGCV